MNVPSLDDSLSCWLEWLEDLHPSEIEMGLARVGRVAERAQIKPARMPVILVGGTNGKGSTVALLTAIYTRAGYKVGTYTSPHINDFNERICINGNMLDDATIVKALHTVEHFREPELLTYFEYTTLASMCAFDQAQCDLAILEVGLGGRLDATNIWNADCSIITSIALDHQEYLGDTRDAIGLEKVAIGRTGKPLVLGELDPPQALLDAANEAEMLLLRPNFKQLPTVAMAGEHQARNAACALLCVETLNNQFAVSAETIEWALANVTVPGRLEHTVYNSVPVLLDVGHNPAAAMAIKQTIAAHYPNHAVHVVLGIMQDKDIAGVAEQLQSLAEAWYCAALDGARAATTAHIVSQLPADAKNVSEHCNVAEAFQTAHSKVLQQLESNGQAIILVVGSFFTVSAIRAYWHTQNTPTGQE